MALSKTARLKRELAEQVDPVLQELGFQGEYPRYTRPLPDRLDTIQFLLNRAGDLGIDISQKLPDGNWPLQPVHRPVHRDMVANLLTHRLGSTPQGGWIHRSTQGWMKSGGMSPDSFPALAEQCIDRLRNEAVPWFAARSVLQCQSLIQQVVPALREMGFTVGDFPEFQRRLPDRTDMIGFYFDQQARMVIEVAQVMPDGSEGRGRPPRPRVAVERMAFYHVSPGLRHRLREPAAGSILTRLIGGGAQAHDRSPVERALDMIRQQAEPWFQSRPVYR